MELIAYDPLDSVDTTTCDWKCRVRVQSVWKGQNRETKEFWGLNMILIDDSNNRIHAFANAKYCDDRFQTLKEGDIYVIKTFKVKDYIGDETFRAVRTRNHVFFTAQTEFLKATTDGLQIEKYAFDLFDMAEMEKLANDNRFLIDMAGKVENVQELITTNKDDVEKSRFKFEISDGSYKVKVTLFDLFGQHTETELKKEDKDNTYIIISCARVGRYEGVPHLSNYPATRIFINPDHYSIKQLKNSWGKKKRTEIPRIVVPATTLTAAAESVKILTVKEIKSLDAEFKMTSAYCQVTAKRFSDRKQWYFHQCTGCDLELDNVAGKFVCSQKNGCGRTIPFPDKRFRLCIFCSDDTGSLGIVFPDHEIKRIIDKTVIDLQTNCADGEDEDKFPVVLNTLLKQKYTINLFISKENLTKGSTIFEAKDIVLHVESIGTHDPNKQNNVEPGVAEMEEISVINDTEHVAIATVTPDTGKSTNMKTRSRKEMEPLIFNDEDISGEKKLKNIKLEKP